MTVSSLSIHSSCLIHLAGYFPEGVLRDIIVYYSCLLHCTKMDFSVAFEGGQRLPLICGCRKMCIRCEVFQLTQQPGAFNYFSAFDTTMFESSLPLPVVQ
jgi:hypothetical protein